jgi:hypothetical protein
MSTDERYTLEGVLGRLQQEKEWADQAYSLLKLISGSEWANSEFNPTVIQAARSIADIVAYLDLKIFEFERAILEDKK